MYRVNCIIPMHNVGPYIKDAVRSLVSQTIGFENLSVCLIDDGSTDSTSSVCASMMAFWSEFDNIHYIRQDHAGTAAALNAGLVWSERHGKGSAFTCFLDGDDVYDKAYIRRLTEYLDSEQLDMCFVAERNFETNSRLLPRYSTYKRGGTRVYDLTQEMLLVRNVCAGMYRSSAISGHRFKESSPYAYGLVYLMDLLREQSKVGFVAEVDYLKRRRLTHDSLSQVAASDPAFYAEFQGSYSDIWQAYFSPQVSMRAVPQFVQESVIYDLVMWGKVDTKHPPADADLDRTASAIVSIVSATEDHILEEDYIPYWLKQHFLVLKHGEAILRSEKLEPRFYYGDYPSSEHIGGTVSVMQTHEKGGVLLIRGFFIKPSYDGITLVMRKCETGEIISADHHLSETNDRKWYLGGEIMRAMDFELRVPLAESAHLEILFDTTSGRTYPAHVKYEASARFTLGNTYFLGDQHCIRRTKLDYVLATEPVTASVIYDRVAQDDDFGDSLLYQEFIRRYFEYKKRRIWLFMDRRTNTDDNAEALFRYANTLDDGIEKYYVVPDVSYMPQFEGVGWTVVWNSFEFRLLLLFAEKFISSHTFEVATTIWDSPSQDRQLKCFVNRFSNVDFVFLQHGVTKENVSGWLNAYRHDIRMLVTANRQEESEFLQPRYGYGPSIVKLTGFPRYDRLTSHPEKIVLFMPTFFKPYTTFRFTYSAALKKSPYFHAIDGLINDPRLLQALRAEGYQLYFKLHEELIVQRNDFHIPDGVTLIDKEITFNRLFDISSVMITDYTSAVFDFAYLEKPVIYYQAVENVKYPDGYFDYADDGFGDVCATQEQSVDKIIYYITRGCVMEEKYVRRVRNFFEYTDRENCRRVYDNILSIGR